MEKLVISKKLVRLFVLLVAALSTNLLQAAPALQQPFQLQQPDGNVITVVHKGDEWNNRTETAGGHTIAQDGEGFWRYVERYNGAEPVLSSEVANDEPPQSLQKHLAPVSSALRPSPNSLGDFMSTHPAEDTDEASPGVAGIRKSEIPVLFLLTSFSDRNGSTHASAWSSFVNNSIKDYFLKNSFGNSLVYGGAETSGTWNDGVVGWLNLGYRHPNTGGNTNTANQYLSRDAIYAADPYVNFASYDRNRDGYVTPNELGVILVVAGHEQATGGPGPSIWAHKWSMYGNARPYVDGVYITDYAQFGELQNHNMATMGIMVHELGHLIYGLPDLYDYDDSSSGIGHFGLMGYGSWGRAFEDQWQGQRPVNMTAWSKYKLGWVIGDEGNGVETMVASGSHYADSSNTVFRASSPYSNEYFLAENRQLLGYDRGFQGLLGTDFGGLAIWHVNESQRNNNNDWNRLVDLEEARGFLGQGRGNAAMLWSASTNTGFHFNSSPNSRLNSGADSGVSIENISYSSESMTARFGGDTGEPPADPDQLAVVSTSAAAIEIGWRDNANNENGYLVQRMENGAVAMEKHLSANVTQFKDEGLSANTSYVYWVYAYNNNGWSSGASISAKTEPIVTVPNAPSGLTLSQSGSSQVRVAWKDNSGNESGFEIQRASWDAGANQWQWKTHTTGANTTSLLDTPPMNTTIYYRIRSYNSAGYSAWTDFMSIFLEQVVSVPSEPSGLTLSQSGSNQVRITWIDNSSNESGFEIQRASWDAGANQWQWKTHTTGANTTSLLDTPAMNTTIYYRIRAVNSVGYSAWTGYKSIYLERAVTVPDAPSGLTLSQSGSNQVHIAWIDNSSNETGFEIQRAFWDSGANQWQWKTHATGANTNNVLDTPAMNTTLYYRIRSTNAAGYSAWTGFESIYLESRVLHFWGENNSTKGSIGDIYVYDNPYTRDREYFELVNLSSSGTYWYFPTNKTDNFYWKYMGVEDPLN